MIKTDNILIKEEDSLYFGSSPDPFTSPAYIPGKRDIGVLKFDENEEYNQDDDDEDIINEKHKFMHHQKFLEIIQFNENNFFKSFIECQVQYKQEISREYKRTNKK